MKKRIVASAALLLLIAPAIVQAVTISMPEDFSPASSLASLDFQLSGKLKTLLEPLIKEAQKSTEESDPEKAKKTAVIFDQLLAEKRIFANFEAPDSFVLSLPVSNEQWATLTKGKTKVTYGSTDVYNGESGAGYISKLGDFLVISIGQSTDPIHKAIDLASGSSTGSLSSNEDYKSMTSSYLPSRFFSFTINFKSLTSALQTALGENPPEEIKILTTLLDMIQFEGGSIAENEGGKGYTFNLKVKGNAEKLKSEGISFNPGGNFIPSLYEKMPNAKPIFYTESFNQKANFAQSKKFMAKLFSMVGGQDSENADIYKIFKDVTGFDLENFYAPFEKEFAFALQYDANSPLPYITVMGNVGENKAAVTKLADDIAQAITKLFTDSNTPEEVYSITKEGGFTKISVYLDLAAKDPAYSGPALPKVTFTIGVTDDGLFVASNYPDIDKASSRTGFAADSDFSSFPEIQNSSSGIFYMNMRNVWAFVDAFTDWLSKSRDQKFLPDLDFYQGYYSGLEKMYGWRDLLLVSQSTDADASVTGKIIIDAAKHSSYQQFIDALKSSDKNGNEVSDFDELFLYKTSVGSSDTNNDGISDIEQLKRGEDPTGEGRLFTDVPQDTYYTSDVSFLRQRGVVAGYKDKSFKPGRSVNRAEFITMVMKAFGNSPLSFGGGRQSPFADVQDPDAWYYKNVMQAYNAGFVSGSMNLETDDLVFRPGDDITRAEAIVILNRASAALKKTQITNECQQVQTSERVSVTKFADVYQDDWYCNAVNNAYENGITKGKTVDSFKPGDKLNRAEAAVMIQRTLEKDLNVQAAGTQSLGELASPLGKSALHFVPSTVLPSGQPRAK